MTARPGKLAVFVIGTRAQLIKVAPVVVACEQAHVPALVLFTGQHRETMQDLVEEFGIRAPQEHLVESGEQSTVRSLLRWAPGTYLCLVRRLCSLRNEHGALDVVVHGDTASTVLGAVAGRRARARVLHLESGLSSFRLFDPFPEEVSRRIVFRFADVALCPTREAADHMRILGRCEVVETGGNTIEDSVWLATRPESRASGATAPPYLVASLHRFQNIFDADRLRALCALLVALASRYTIHFVLHPATRKRLQVLQLDQLLAEAPALRLAPRLGYRQFLRLAAGAECVLTDGGSNQEELAVLGVPTIVMRRRTERTDGLGENALMEAEVPGGVAAYCLAGRFSDLRRPSRIVSAMGPSRVVAEVLGR